MNREEFKQQLKDKYELTLKTLDLIPEDMPLQDVGPGTASLGGTYEEVSAMRSRLRKQLGNYKMKYYFPSCGSLSIRYFYPGLDVHFWASNAEQALLELTGGTCHIETVATTEKKVVCDI